MKQISWTRLLLSIALPVGVGVLASVFTQSGVDTWYRNIKKPSWNPPDAVFAPVWTTLYILMGIALYLIWQSNAAARVKRLAIGFWIAQLALNALWSFLFFSLHDIGLALVEIILLWLAILSTIFLFARVHKAAAWLMVPYISWVSFAAILNYTIWQLNS
jgi:tryptophan-rich sensory protein